MYFGNGGTLLKGRKKTSVSDDTDFYEDDYEIISNDKELMEALK